VHCPAYVTSVPALKSIGLRPHVTPLAGYTLIIIANVRCASCLVSRYLQWFIRTGIGPHLLCLAVCSATQRIVTSVPRTNHQWHPIALNPIVHGSDPVRSPMIFGILMTVNPHYRRRNGPRTVKRPKCNWPSHNRKPRHRPSVTPKPLHPLYHFMAWGLSPLRRLKEVAR
jgi:hypothetical protein